MASNAADECPFCQASLGSCENPLRLPCGHGGCGPCLNEFVQKNGYVCCAACWRNWRADVFPHLERLQFSDGEVATKPASRSHMCDCCGDKPLVKYCNDCSKGFCSATIGFHFKLFGDSHTMVAEPESPTRVKTPTNLTEAQTLSDQPLCKVHADKVFMACMHCHHLFCSQCDLQTRCDAADTAGHRVQTIPHVNLHVKESLKSFVKRTDGKLFGIQQLEDTTQTRLGAMKQQKELLLKRVETLVEKQLAYVKAKGEQAKRSIETRFTSHAEASEHQLAHLSSLRKMVELEREKTEAFISDSSMADLVLGFDSRRSKLKDVLAIPIKTRFGAEGDLFTAVHNQAKFELILVEPTAVNDQLQTSDQQVHHREAHLQSLEPHSMRHNRPPSAERQPIIDGRDRGTAAIRGRGEAVRGGMVRGGAVRGGMVRGGAVRGGMIRGAFRGAYKGSGRGRSSPSLPGPAALRTMDFLSKLPTETFAQCVLHLPDGRLLVGCEDGVKLFSQQGAFQQLISTRRVIGMAIDEASLYLGSNNNITTKLVRFELIDVSLLLALGADGFDAENAKVLPSTKMACVQELVCLSALDQLLAFVTEDKPNCVCLVALGGENHEDKEIETTMEKIQDILLCPDSTLIAVGGTSVACYRISDKAELWKTDELSAAVGVCLGPQDTIIVASETKRLIYVLSPNTGAVIKELKDSKIPTKFSSISFHDGTLSIACQHEKSVKSFTLS